MVGIDAKVNVGTIDEISHTLRLRNARPRRNGGLFCRVAASSNKSNVADTKNRAQEFFQIHVLPSVDDWRRDPIDIRLAMHAAVTLNQMADYFWHAYSQSDSAKIFGKTSVGGFRRELGQQYPSFALIRDVAEAHKHVKLNRSDRYLTSAGQTTVIKFGYGEVEFGVGEHAGSPEVIITLDNGTKRHFSSVVEDTVKMWESLLT